MWGAMAGIAALLLLALAVPVAAKQRFHLRVERERRAARSAMAGIAGRTLPAFDPEVAEAAGRFRFRGIFPFRPGYSNHFEPPTEGECAAIRAWCATNPEAVALFERLSAPTSAAPATAAHLYSTLVLGVVLTSTFIVSEVPAATTLLVGVKALDVISHTLTVYSM